MKQRIERWTFKPVQTQKPLEFGGLTHPFCAETTKATTAWSGPGITKNVEEMARHTANHAVDSGDIYIYIQNICLSNPFCGWNWFLKPWGRGECNANI